MDGNGRKDTFGKGNSTSLGEESTLLGLHPTLNLVKAIFKGLDRIVDRIDVGAKVFQREIAPAKAKLFGNIISSVRGVEAREEDFGFRRADF